MLIPDDGERFESYLKQFRPVDAEPLAQKSPRRAKLRSFALFAAVAAVLVILVPAAAFWYRHGRFTPPTPEAAPVKVTLGQAELALAQDSSFDEALDRLERTSKPQRKSKPGNHVQSALQVLGREKL